MNGIQKLKAGQTGDEKNILVREYRFQFRASPLEAETIKNLASAAGYSTIAFFLRDIALAGEPSQGTKKSKLKDRKKLVNDLARVGNNLNQIARHLNQRSPINDSMEIEILEMKLILEHIKTKLGSTSQ